MKRFAELLDRLSYEPGRNAKLRLIADYLRTTPDPDRGWALAALTGALSFQYAKAGMIRALIAERTDPALFALSYDYVGDLSETVALMWPSSIPPLKGEMAAKRPGGVGLQMAPMSPTRRPAAAALPRERGRDKKTNPHRRRRNSVHPRQGAIAGTSRALARCPRRDRPLGAAQTRDWRPSHRRLGPACQKRSGFAR